MTPAAGSRLDVALALRRIALIFWHDFAPIVVLGFAMVTIPQVTLALAGSHGGSTIVATAGGMLRVLYIVIVSHGALARLAARPLVLSAFAREGLAASPRGLSVALLLGAGTVLALVALLLAGLAGPFAILVRGAIVALALGVLVVALPAIPVALAERLDPGGALARAAALTRGSLGRIAAVVIVFAMTVVPARIVISATIYGLGATAAHIATVDAAMTLASPGLWLIALFDLLAWGTGAVVPAVVYAGLIAD